MWCYKDMGLWGGHMEGCIFMSGINALVRGYSHRSLVTFCRVRLQGEVCNLEESPHPTVLLLVLSC